MKPVLSIILPTYNCELYINAVLDGILSQHFQDYEVIILDNFSEDNTVNKIKLNYAYEKRIKLNVEKDRGIYDAMNKGIEKATGEWLYFLGADDVFAGAEVLEQISLFFTKPIDIIYGDILWLPDNIKEEGEWTPPIFLNRNINHQRIFYRKNLFKKYGNYNLKYKIAADHELNIRFFCSKTISKLYIPLTIAKYYSGGFSANKIDELFWDDWKLIIYPNFQQYISSKEIYYSLGPYCRYNIYQRNYIKALKNIYNIFIHTGNIGFLKLMGKHLIKSFYTGAS